MPPPEADYDPGAKRGRGKKKAGRGRSGAVTVRTRGARRR